MTSAKEVAKQFLEGLGKRDFDSMFAVTDTNGAWWVLGRSDKVPFGGTVTFADRRKELEGYMGKMTKYDFEILDLVAEGPKVVVEGISRGSGPVDGAEYENQVVMVILVNDQGKVSSVREFLDPFEVFAYAEANAKA